MHKKVANTFLLCYNYYGDNMEKDIFCKIIDGEIPSYKLYEDEVCLAFLDINPESNGHTLVIPKKHFLDIYDMDDETLKHIFSVARTLSKKITNKLNASGVIFTQNNGDPQVVKHYHLHIIPFYVNNELIDVKEIFNKLND